MKNESALLPREDTERVTKAETEKGDTNRHHKNNHSIQ